MRTEVEDGFSSVVPAAVPGLGDLGPTEPRCKLTHAALRYAPFKPVYAKTTGAAVHVLGVDLAGTETRCTRVIDPPRGGD